MNLVVSPLGRCKLLKYCPQEQEQCALVGCVVLDGESWYLKSSRLWMVVTDDCSSVAPNSDRSSATTFPPWMRSFSPTKRPDVASNHSANDLSIFTVRLVQNFTARPPDCLNQTPTQPTTSRSIPQHHHNVQTKPQVPGDRHHQEIVFREIGRVGIVDER